MESVIHSGSKKKNTKEKSNTEKNISKANNNVERQRRETEKKSENGSRTIRTEHKCKKDQNKSQKIAMLARQHDQKRQVMRNDCIMQKWNNKNVC